MSTAYLPDGNGPEFEVVQPGSDVRVRLPGAVAATRTHCAGGPLDPMTWSESVPLPGGRLLLGVGRLADWRGAETACLATRETIHAMALAGEDLSEILGRQGRIHDDASGSMAGVYAIVEPDGEWTQVAMVGTEASLWHLSPIGIEQQVIGPSPSEEIPERRIRSREGETLVGLVNDRSWRRILLPTVRQIVSVDLGPSGSEQSAVALCGRLYWALQPGAAAFAVKRIAARTDGRPLTPGTAITPERRPGSQRAAPVGHT